MSYSNWFVGTLLVITTVLISVYGESPKTEYINGENKSGVSATPVKRPSFFVGSRYGRSPYYSKHMQNLNIVPRNDRFFLGSRYGKRSDEYMQEIVDPEPSRDNNGVLFMTCAYTGVKDFYRCYKGYDDATNDQTGFDHENSTF